MQHRLADEINFVLLAHFPEDRALLYSRQFADSIFKWALHEAGVRNIFPAWENPPFAVLYGSKAYTLLQHLDINSRVRDSTLIDALHEGKSVDEIMRMSIYEMAPNATRELREKLAAQTQIEVRVKTTKLHKCPRCGTSHARYNQAQTRAADEPITTFLQCVNCGHDWRK